jgi:hypothetical protein
MHALIHMRRTVLPFHAMHDQITSNAQVIKQKSPQGYMTNFHHRHNIRLAVSEEIPPKAVQNRIVQEGERSDHRHNMTTLVVDAWKDKYGMSKETRHSQDQVARRFACLFARRICPSRVQTP